MENMLWAAQQYYERNAPFARANGTLTPATEDSFRELANLYALMTSIDMNDPKGPGRYVNMHKLFNQLTRYFGLCPRNPPNKKDEEPSEW